MTRRSIEAGKAVIVVDILDKANASFSKLTSKMMASARGLRNLGQSSAGAGLLTGLVTRSVINNFVEFDDKILNLTAKLGYFGVETDKQKASIKDLTKVIIDLGRVTSYTSAEVADAAISLAQAGFSVTEIKSSLKSVLDLARGTNYALGDSADLLANTIRTFNLFKPGDNAEVLAENMATINHVASMMVKATRLGTIEIQDLRESMKYAGGTAVNMGANLSTVLGLLVRMSDTGLKASLAGTSMNTAFQNLANNLEALQGKLPKFQLFVSTLQDGTKGVDFGQTLKSLMDATKGMDRLEKVKLFQDVFNIRGARMISSVQDMERVQFFIKEIASAGEEAALASAKMESGIGGAIRRLISNLDSLNIAMGYTFNESAIAMANFATVGVAALEKLTDSYKILIGTLVFSPVIFASIAAGALILSVVLARLRTVIIGLGAAFGGLKKFGGFLGGSLINTGGMIASAVNTRNIKIEAYKKSQERVFRANLAVDQALAAANAKKTQAAVIAATEKVYAGSKMKKAISATLSMQKARAAIGIKVPGRIASIKQRVKDAKEAYKVQQGYVSEKLMHMADEEHFSNVRKAAKAAGNKQLALQAGQAKRIAAGKKLIAHRKYMAAPGGLATLFKGASLAKSASGLVSLSMGFIRLTATMSRFVFSWNFVGLAFNALLMFGHKIPFIVNIFKTLGDGFKAAFTEIGRIATYAAPAIKLFSLAFEAFVKGDTDVGIAAVSAGFEGLVSIIQNQLMAAWNMFAAKVAYIWVTLKQIGTIIWTTIDALLEGLVSVGGTLASPLMQGISDMFSGDGGNFAENVRTVFYGIAIGLNDFITNFSIAATRFITQGFQFVNKFQKALGEAISYIPGTLDTGSLIVEQAAANDHMDDFNENVAVGKLKGESMKRARAITKAFEETGEEINSDRINASAKLNQDSMKIQNEMAQFLNKLTIDLDVRQAARDADAKRLQELQNRDKSVPGVPAPNAAMQNFGYQLSTLVGSIQSVSGNRLLKESPKELEVQQEISAKMDTLINTVKTQGM